MKFKSMNKIHEGNFISRYDLTYITADGKEKVYEMISRNRHIDSFEELQNHKTDAVVLIMHDEDGEKILLNKEFRMAAGTWVYNFPAGMIDPGEKPMEAAVRELKEETGLDIVEVEDVMNESFSAIGFSNEKNIVVVGKAAGNFAKSSSSFEEIHAAWYTRKEIAALLKTEYFAARTQAYCYMWAKGTN